MVIGLNWRRLGLVVGHGFKTQGPQNFFFWNIPHWLMTGCHVALFHSTDKCHLSTIDWSNCLPLVYPVSKPAQSPSARECHIISCTVNMLTSTLTFWPVDLWLFTSFGFRSECDNFRIRSPFDKVNIPPESGRWAGRNGVGFVGFRALSFLSIFHALTALLNPISDHTSWSVRIFRNDYGWVLFTCINWPLGNLTKEWEKKWIIHPLT